MYVSGPPFLALNRRDVTNAVAGWRSFHEASDLDAADALSREDGSKGDGVQGWLVPNTGAERRSGQERDKTAAPARPE